MGGLHDLSLLRQSGGSGPASGGAPSLRPPTAPGALPLPSAGPAPGGGGLHALLSPTHLSPTHLSPTLPPSAGAARSDAIFTSTPTSASHRDALPGLPVRDAAVPHAGAIPPGSVADGPVTDGKVPVPEKPGETMDGNRSGNLSRPESKSSPEGAPASHNIFRELRALTPDQLAVRLRDDLAGVGYFIQDVVLHALMESLYSCRPLLLEGPPGAGKTHLAEKLAEAYGLPKAKLSCAEGIQREQALYTWNRALQQMYLTQERERGRSLDEIRPEIYGLSFLDAGPILRAFSWGMEGRPGILIIDEIDKLSPGSSDMLLEPFSEWSISIEYYSGPEIRLSDPATRPLVIMTSNDIRHGVSAPLRNRALYAYLTPPTLDERIRILHYNGASLSMEVFRTAVDILERIQLQLKLMDPPGLRKGAAFLQSLSQKKVTQLTAAVLEQHLCYLTGNESDFKRLRNFIPSLIEQSHFPSPELKRLVEQHYAVVNNTVAESSPLVSQALVACNEITDQLDGLFTSICHDHSDHLPV